METLTPEQLQTDNKFVNDLEKSIKEWQIELAWHERELVEQSLIDAREGRRSNRYLVLEAREKDLKRYLKDAQDKLAGIAKRYNVGPLKNLLLDALNNLRP
jgi:hypothetical protein